MTDFLSYIWYISVYKISKLRSVTKKFMCSCSSTHLCRDAGVILLPFIVILSMTAMLSLNGQYGCNSSLSSVLLDGHACIIQGVKSFRLLLSCITCLVSSAIIQSGMSVHISMAMMFKSISRISSSLPSLWLYLDCQYTISNYGPDLYRSPISYWWICSSILCGFSHGGCYNLLEDHEHWFMICYHAHFMAEAVVVEFFQHVQYSQCLSFSITTLCFVLVKLLLVNAI